jgi:hypothetical protein
VATGQCQSKSAAICTWLQFPSLVDARPPASHPTADSQDVRYLTPRIEQVAKEDQERADWDSMSVERRR